MELGGDGWRWIELGARLSNTQTVIMSSGSSDSESISECKFETTLESDKESIHGCYSNIV